MQDVFVRNIMESMSIGLVVINTAGEILAVNTAAETILGFTREELKTRGWAELFFDNTDNIAFNQFIVDVIEYQKLNQIRETPYTKPDGKRLYLSITSSFIHDQGKPIGVIMLFDDVTEVRELHERERRILEERNRLHHERVESLNRFASSIAHQLRNPLVTIGGFAQRMFRVNDPECPESANAEFILTEVKRLETIVKVVEEYTALSHVTIQSAALKELIEPLRRDIDTLASSRKKTIQWDITLNTSTVSVDPFYFSRALREILLNSLEAFKKEAGKITIKADSVNDDVILEIADTGRGISRDDIPYVFDPFFTTKVTNIGMGLSTAQRIISEHHGKIVIGGEPGAGARVTITLPAYPLPDLPK